MEAPHAAECAGRRYVFRLGVLDTRRLGDGIHTIVATARDIRGNTSALRTTFTIYNRPGLPPATPQA